MDKPSTRATLIQCNIYILNNLLFKSRNKNHYSVIAMDYILPTNNHEKNMSTK